MYFDTLNWIQRIHSSGGRGKPWNCEQTHNFPRINRIMFYNRVQSTIIHEQWYQPCRNLSFLVNSIQECGILCLFSQLFAISKLFPNSNRMKSFTFQLSISKYIKDDTKYEEISHLHPIVWWMGWIGRYYAISSCWGFFATPIA